MPRLASVFSTLAREGEPMTHYIVPAGCGCDEWRNGIQRFTRYEQDTEVVITDDQDGYLWGYLVDDEAVRVRIAPVLRNKIREVNNA